MGEHPALFKSGKCQKRHTRTQITNMHLCEECVCKFQPVGELVGVLPIEGVLPELAVALQQGGAVPVLHAVADGVELGCGQSSNNNKLSFPPLGPS
jgi:hypothetical protein